MATKNETTTEIMPAVDFAQIASGNMSVINTMNTDTFEGKVTILNALNNATSLKVAKDTILDICDCIAMPGVRKGRNGAPDTECTNTYLIDTEGHAWFSQSDGIARSVKMIAMMFPDFGKSTKEGCLHGKVVESVLDNGNTIKTFVLDM